MLTKKKLSVRINLGQGEFGAELGPDVWLEGYRCSATVTGVTAGGSAKLSLQIYGIPPLIMNKLSTLGMSFNLINRDRIEVLAGDENALHKVFSGTIHSAYGDYSAQPDVPLVLEATSGFYEQLRWIPPTSLPGAVDVGQVIETLAKQAGFAYRNFGVTSVLSDVTINGSAIDQIRYLAEAASVACLIDSDCVTIMPNGTAPKGEPIKMSPNTGMIGYPAFSAGGIVIRHLFDPRVMVGATIDVETSVPQANGRFFVYGMQHQLSSETPDGPWYSTAYMNSTTNFIPKLAG